MATLKQRLRRKNTIGEYDTIHLETSADLVMMADGKTTVSDEVIDIESRISKVPAPVAPHNTGDIITWEGYEWLVVHVGLKLMVMITNNVLSKVGYNSNETTYAGSRLAALASEMENSLSDEAKSHLSDVKIHGVTAKVFIPTAAQCGAYTYSPGTFDWFKTLDNRKAYYNGNPCSWWTSTNVRVTEVSGGTSQTVIKGAYIEKSNNTIVTYSSRTSNLGFRPCVAYML